MSYKGEEITGAKRRRSYRVEAHNPAQGAKSITFFEEDLTELSNGLMINTPAGQIRAQLTDPSIEFEIVNPADDKPMGQYATHGQVYALLHSLYLSLAYARDEAEANPPEPDTPIEE